MSLLCSCGDAAISDITVNDCPQKFGQVQKIVLQRKFSTGSTLNEIVISTNNPNLLATWTALTGATDGTKAQTSPFLQNPESEPGEKREYGGGNATLGGIPLLVGRNPSTMNAEILNYKQVTIEEMKKYECENVGVFLIDEFGQIGGLTDDLGTPTKFKPIPIHSLFVSDMKLGGFEEPNKNMLSWYFEPNWSDKFHIVTPSDFDALTQL